MLSSPLSCKITISCFLITLVLACSQSLYIPTAETVTNDQLLQDLTVGRKLYIQSCGSCHNLYKPEKFTADKWEHEIDEMKDDAKISDAEAALILKYVTGYTQS